MSPMMDPRTAGLAALAIAATAFILFVLGHPIFTGP